ncbi:uncharacterized protein [Amphiura filiformis]|uniref:uncharacterized protein isoform X2 n=1 Tax=Amphiura filiformis TaxID=82378 RepID=UPI003B212098
MNRFYGAGPGGPNPGLGFGQGHMHAGGGGPGGPQGGNVTNSNDPKAKASRVFLGNLNTGYVTREEVEQIFGRYGRITGVSLHKGFGFVQYTSEYCARCAVEGEHGRIMANQPLDLRIASEPNPTRPKGFKRIINEYAYAGYVDPNSLPVHPASGSGQGFGPPAAKKVKRFFNNSQMKGFPAEGDEPNNWHCAFCKEELGGPWQLMKHARTAHDTQIYLDDGNSEQAPGTGQ